MLSLGLGSQPTTECGIFGSYQCLELDGNSDYVTLPSGIIALSSLNNGSISCWVDLRDNDGATSQTIVRIANDTSNENATLQFHRSNTEFRAVYKIGGVYKEATYNDASLDLAGYMAQGWVHLAMTWESDGEGTGEVKIYFNGVHRETVAQNATWDLDSNPIDMITIGSTDAGAASFTDGFIDQVGIWNTPKPAAEVLAIYNSGNMRDLTTVHDRGPLHIPEGLIGYYQFEGNALDSSSTKAHGTLVGTAGFNTTQP
tara:strand:+ start:604 stop:1374 length:771 start_codon:yes stop_codon:yes gene_type:complete